jgi:hypothetical protein
MTAVGQSGIALGAPDAQRRVPVNAQKLLPGSSVAAAPRLLQAGHASNLYGGQRQIDH